MKKLLLLFFLFSLALQAQENEEFRSTWVITWEHMNAGNSAEQNKALVRKILDDHVKANMNAVLWQARQSGTAYYHSSYEPWGYYAGSTYPGYDPLEYAIEEAHKRGLELHAWFNCFHTSSTVAGTPAYEHPEWVCTNEDGNFMTSSRCLSPGLEEVREYTINVAMEIVRNYDIDGLHLDFVRWNEYDEDDMDPDMPEREQVSILDGQLIAEKEKLGQTLRGTKRYIYDAEHPANGPIPDGFSSWDDWRRWTVTEFVKTLHDSVQSVKPWVRLSPAALGKYKAGGTSGWNGYYIVFQDAAKWFNEGYVDQLTPMHYHWTTGSSFVNTLTTDWLPNIQQGIAEDRMYSVGPGSYILASNNVWDNHEQIVEDTRALGWVDGYQFFSYGQWQTHEYFEEASDLFFTSKTKVRPIVNSFTPDAPVVSLEKIDSLEYKLTIAPPDTVSEAYWFAIYRSEDDLLDPATDQIIKLAFSDTVTTYNDKFEDTEYFQGKFKYYTTMLNRHWNESAISNSVETDEVFVAEPAPETPSFIAARSLSPTMGAVKMTSKEFADNYFVLLSSDGENFTDTVSAADTLIFIPDLEQNTTYFLRIASGNERGLSPLSDQLFAFATSGESEKILVVNGFDRGTNIRLDYIRFYTAPLAFSNKGFSYALNEAVIAGEVLLTDFDKVIWILGDESTSESTFEPSEQEKVKTFLRQGGKLFVSGAEIGWDLGRSGSSSAEDLDFYNNFLKANYVADAPGNTQGQYYTLSPVEGGYFDGLFDLNFDNGTQGTFDVDWPDVIEPNGGSVSEFSFKNAPAGSDIGGVSYRGMFPEGTEEGAVIYMTVPFETIYPENARIALMSLVLQYLDASTSVDETVSEMPSDYVLYQNYPNPFNPATVIKFALPKAENVSLKIYNTLGEEVAQLLNKEMGAGYHTVDFDASGLSSGVYIYRIEAGEFTQVNKMMLLK